MTSRVEQENQAKAAEAERLQKKIDREARDAKARDAFAKLVRTNQQDSSVQRQKNEKQAESQRGEEHAGKTARQAQEGDRAARSARGGVQQQSKAMEQARSFQGVLTNQQSATREADKGRVERRDQGTKKDRVEKDDREVGIRRQETKKEVEAEAARIEAREQARPNAAIQGDNRGSSGGSDKGSEDNAASAIAQARKAAAPQAQGVQAPREVKQIPPELLEKLASAVYLGVNQKGLKEFQIELKDGPLKGAFLKISADGGKVALRFEGVGADEKRLLEASKGDLLRRLEKKGLSLSKLEVA
jgi:hypothetical protein